MIVRTLPTAIQMMTQPDHARLAGQIMTRSSRLRNHPRRESILLAVAEHDNGWREEDAHPTVHPETGQVVDFVTAPLAVRHRVWPRAVDRLRADPWAAALVAQHAITAYERYRPDRAWDRFFAEMEAARDRMLLAHGGPLGELLADYVYVRLGDLISLAFCTGWTDEQRFGEWTVQLHGEQVLVTPDPFAGSVVPLAISARELPLSTFATDDDVRQRLLDAKIVTISGEARGGF